MPKKLTYEQVKNLIKSKGYELISSEYISAHKKLVLKCSIHGEFESSYASIYTNSGCPKCAIKSFTEKMTKYTLDDFKKYLEQYNIEMIDGEYKSVTSKMKVKCKTCENIWNTSFDQLKQKEIKCPSCSKKQCGINSRLSIEDVKARVNDCGYTLLSEEYNGFHENIRVKCEKHNHIWDTTLGNLTTSKYGCKKCADENNTRSNKYSIIEINQIMEEMIQTWIDGDYKNVDSKLTLKCNKHNKIWETTFRILRKTHGCPECSKEYKRSIFSKNIEEVIKYIENEGYEYISGEYFNLTSKLKIKCKYCGETWDISFGNFVNGRRCPICKMSKGERYIYDYFKLHNIQFEFQYSFDDLLSYFDNLLRFDFGILENNSLKYLVEYDGEFHYQPIISQERLELQQEYDRMKNEYCKKNNIKLIRIPYWEFENLENILDDILIKNNRNNQFIL